MPTTGDVDATQDLMLNAFTPDTNLDATSLDIGVGDKDTKKKRALLRFDLSAAPSRCLVTSCKLSLYVDAITGTPGAGKVRRVAEVWIEEQATWNNRVTGTGWTNAGCGTPTSSTTTDQHSYSAPSGTGWWTEGSSANLIAQAQYAIDNDVESAQSMQVVFQSDDESTVSTDIRCEEHTETNAAYATVRYRRRIHVAWLPQTPAGLAVSLLCLGLGAIIQRRRVLVVNRHQRVLFHGGLLRYAFYRFCRWCFGG